MIKDTVKAKSRTISQIAYFKQRTISQSGWSVGSYQNLRCFYWVTLKMTSSFRWNIMKWYSFILYSPLTTPLFKINFRAVL